MSESDKLLKQLWKQERLDRRELYADFREEVGTYRERMGDITDASYFHPIEDEFGEGSAVVIDYGGKSLDGYTYLSKVTEGINQRGVFVRNSRSFSVGKVRHVLRWRFLKERTYNLGDPDNEFGGYAIDEGPSSNVGRRLLFGGRQSRSEWEKRLWLYQKFAPEYYWHPPDGEQFRVREILGQAVGEIATIGQVTAALPVTSEVRALHGI